MKKLVLFLFGLTIYLSAKADDVTALISPANTGLSNGAISLVISGGYAPYTFSWTGPDGFSSSLQDISALAPGEYCVTVIDNYCGTSTSCYTVEESQLNTISNNLISSFTISPNPFSTYLNAQFEIIKSGDYIIQLYDLTGKLVYSLQKQFSTGQVGLNIKDLEHLAAGQYTMQIASQSAVIERVVLIKQ